MTNVFQAMFEPQQPLKSQMNGQSHGFATAHARMLGKRQRSASPISTMDDTMKGHQHKRTKPAWTALPTPDGEAGFAQARAGNQMTATGFFDLTNIMPSDASGLQPNRHQQQFPQHPYPFPFPSPNHLSPSGLVLPDSTMTNSTFAGEMTPGTTIVPSRPVEMTFAPTSPLEREGSHGSINELRARMASSRLQGYSDLPSVEDDHDGANDGDDEMAVPDNSMRTIHRGGQNDVSMDVPIPRPPRNSFSSFAHGPDQMQHGKPFAAMISDRLAQSSSDTSQPNSRRSNISDNMGMAEQYFVDGMRGVEQQHQGWSSPTAVGDQDAQQCRQAGDVDMNGTSAPEQSSHHLQTQHPIEHAQADLYQHRQEHQRQEHQRQQHHQRPFNNDQWHTGSTYENGHAGHSSLFQHTFQVSNSTQAIHNKQKFTMGPRADCAKCLAGSSGHAGHWL